MFFCAAECCNDDCERILLSSLEVQTILQNFGQNTVVEFDFLLLVLNSLELIRDAMLEA